MSDPWAMKIALASAVAAGMLRTTPGIEANITAAALWLRGSEFTEALDAVLRQIPGERYHITPTGALIPAGAKLPTQLLPAGAWQPLGHVLTVMLPPSALPARPPARILCGLVPCTTEAPANFMFAGRRAWSQWADGAESVRLGALRFALSHDTAAIHGHPLPNLRGMRHVERQGVVVPCGYTLSPAVDEATMAEACNLAPGDLIVMGFDGQCDFLSAEMFVRASRSAVRLSDQAPADPALAEGPL